MTMRLRATESRAALPIQPDPELLVDARAEMSLSRALSENTKRFFGLILGYKEMPNGLFYPHDLRVSTAIAWKQSLPWYY